MFTSLTVDNWRQFASAQIVFHPRLTILTGANGSGKTTLLHILGGQTGWKFEFAGRQPLSSRGIKKQLKGAFSGTPESGSGGRTAREIGSIIYSDGQSAKLNEIVGGDGKTGFQVTPPRKINGLFVPSHRPLPAAMPVKDIPTKLEPRQQLFDRYLNAYRQHFSVNVRIESTPAHRIKSSLISLATFGYGSRAVMRDEDAVEMFEGFESILHQVLPQNIGFRRLLVEVPDILLETDTGSFPFDASSGGVLAIIDLAWQLFLCSLIYEQFVVVIDEPENHLHPQLQRSLLPDFTRVFPSAQFIAATHSPLVVSSVSDSNVYVLNYDEDRKVKCQQLDLVNRAGSSNEILRDVLGVPVSAPEWAEEKLDSLVESYLSQEITEDLLIKIRTEMGQLGLEELFPKAIARVMERKP
jgi:hypothetical protein